MRVLSADDMIKIITQLKDAGFETVIIDKDGAISAHKHAQPLPNETEEVELKPSQIEQVMMPTLDYTEEEIKYYATEYFDILQAQKKDRSNKDGE